MRDYDIFDPYFHAKLRINDMEEHIHSLNQIIARLEEELGAAREEKEDD